MSQENVDVAHRAYDAFNRRDLDAFLALMDDDVEVDSRLVAIEGSYQGHDGVRRWWKDLHEVRTRHHGRGKGSGVEVEQQMIFQLWTLRHDKIVRAKMNYDKAKALKAAGLRE